nr:nucleolar protein 16 [Quercus suber]
MIGHCYSSVNTCHIESSSTLTCNWSSISCVLNAATPPLIEDLSSAAAQQTENAAATTTINKYCRRAMIDKFSRRIRTIRARHRDNLRDPSRELQKKKNRSGIQKVRQKPKSKKRILHNPIIAQNWDQSQSLAQNYKRLGLTAKLNKNTGGVERKAHDLEEQTARDDPLSIVATSRKGGVGDIQLEEAKIERDEETGAILRVLDDPGKSTKANRLGDLLGDDDDDDDAVEQQGRGFNQHATNSRAMPARARTVEAKTAVIEALEQEASRPVAKYKHKQSQGEKVFVEELVQKYGEDYAKMARDMKINYMQRSEGDIKRRVKRWKEAGGSMG